MKVAEKDIERIIYCSSWLQMTVYSGIIAVSILYAAKFIVPLWHLIGDFSVSNENAIMLSALGFIVISVIINLLAVVFILVYLTFANKIELDKQIDKPDWLSKINASTLEVKLIISLVSFSGVHLSKTFIDLHKIPTQDTLLQTGIHFVFLLSSIFLAYSDKIMHSYKSSEAQ
jgi:uncharacterized protein (TIGR00645 family)